MNTGPEMRVSIAIRRICCWIFFCHVLQITASYEQLSTDTETREFCHKEAIHMSCPDSNLPQPQQQVLLMLSARYGRMKKGKCVIGDYALGCSVDALPFMDATCSGHRECRFRLVDSSLDGRAQCPEDAASYLEVTYKCIPIVTPIRGSCVQQKSVDAQLPSGNIASISAQEYGYGATECPWVVRASAGQRISLAIRYFPPESLGESGSVLGGKCYELATVDESFDRHVLTTCDGSPAHRQKDVFVSKGSEIKIYMVGKKLLANLGKFIVLFQVIGCADMTAPFNSSLRREGDKLTIKCNFSDPTWYMVCRNGSWHGDTVNCNAGVASAWNLGQIFDKNNFPFGILIVVSTGVALGIFFGGLLLACVVVYMKRQQRLEVIRHQFSSELGNIDECTHRMTPDLAEFAFSDDHQLPMAGTKTLQRQAFRKTGATIDRYLDITCRHPETAPCTLADYNISSMADYDKQQQQQQQQLTGLDTREFIQASAVKNHVYEMPRAIR